LVGLNNAAPDEVWGRVVLLLLRHRPVVGGEEPRILMRRDGALAAGCVLGAISPAVVLQRGETLRRLRYVACASCQAMAESDPLAPDRSALARCAPASHLQCR
jgi:hypothetical protein